MGFCNPLLKPDLLSISDCTSDFEVRHKTEKKISILSRPIASLCDLLKLAKYLFENSAQDFSLNAMAPSPLAWVGEIPYVSNVSRGERGSRAIWDSVFFFILACKIL